MVGMERNLNALISVLLNAILLAAFEVQFFWHEPSCPLCLMQRLCMISVGISALLNVRFGVRTSHYALMLLSSLVGGGIALYQIILTIFSGFPLFGLPVFGLSLSLWSFIVFVCCILAVAFLLLLYNPLRAEEVTKQGLTLWHRCAFAFVLIIVIANSVTTFMQCGLDPC
ncbi:Disulfide bond formation protein B [Chlamydiales bacterium STE3]|nr:Disulfide bond formation protein B [Chlamydiales bacterium STE3]